MRSFSFFVWIALVSGCMGMVGCGTSLPPMHPVQGKIEVDGKPLASGQVSLVRVNQDADKGVPPSNGTITAGSFQIFTGGKTGAPLGKYKVVVTPSMVPPSGEAKMPPKTPFNEKYRQEKNTPLILDVVAEPAPGAYDLQLSK